MGLQSDSTMFEICLNMFGNILTFHSVVKFTGTASLKIIIVFFSFGGAGVFFFLLFYYSYVHTRLGSFLPPVPTPSLTTHSAPSLSPPPPQYPALNTVLTVALLS
jgi:hypothetical protein